MNFISHRLEGGIGRQSLLSIGFFVFGLIAACILANYIVANDFTKLAFDGIACVGAAIIAATTINWRTGLYLMLAWLLF